MKHTIALGLALSLSPLAAIGEGNADAGPPKQLVLCGSCHGKDGNSRIPGYPHLAAQDQTYLSNSLTAYRNGSRRHMSMSSIAQKLSDQDIAELAKYFAAQPRK